MKRKLLTVLGIAATSLWSVANAVPVTFDLGNGGAGTTHTSGYTVSGSGQSVTIYGENITGNGTTASPGNGNSPNDGGAGHISSGLSVFSVTSGVGSNNASGLGPYVAAQGGFTSQLGITEYDILLINLSGITTGSTVQFLMTQSPAISDSFNVWQGTNAVSTPNSGGGVTGIGPVGGLATQGGTNPLTTEIITGQTLSNTTNQATFTLNNLAANQWIAIQADCHYLLLDTITITAPSGVPEPSFYGFFAIAMVGLVFGARKLRARAVAEKA